MARDKHRLFRCGACRRWMRATRKLPSCIGCGSHDVYEPIKPKLDLQHRAPIGLAAK